MEAYATSEDLAAYWRELSDAEKARADTLLSYASTIVRAHCGCDPSDADAARFVACDMVKTAMQADMDMPPAMQVTMSGGPYSRTTLYANPTGDMYWKSHYDMLLGLTGLSFGCMKARTAYDG